MRIQWQNGYGDKSEVVSKEKRERRTACRACMNGNAGGDPNPEYIVMVSGHAGPAGRLPLCRAHAIALANQIIDTAESIE